MKSFVIAILLTFTFVGSANAESTTVKPLVLKLSAALKPIGPPDVTVGPVTKGRVFYRRKLTYRRTGVLAASLILTGPGGDVTLPKGTALFAVPPQWPYQGKIIWCTLMQKEVHQICLLHDQGKAIWAQENQDVTFTASVSLPVQTDGAPEPEVDETVPTATKDFTVEIGLGDPDVLNKPIPLTNGKGYIVASPVSDMVVTYRYLDAGVEKLFGYREYPQPVDVTIDGAELNYGSSTKTFSASTSMPLPQDAIPTNPVTTASLPESTRSSSSATEQTMVPVQSVIDTPWLFGSEQVNPETVTITNKPLAKGDIILTGKANLTMRYRLKTALPVPGTLAGAFAALDAGAYAYASVETAYQANGQAYQNALWCALGAVHPWTGPRPATLCIPQSPTDRGGGQLDKGWQIDGYGSGVVATHYTPLDLATDPDPSPTIDTVQMRLGWVNKSQVEVRLGIVKDDVFVCPRSYDLSFDVHGIAKLYLWDRVISFERQGAAILVTVASSSSNFGPLYGKVEVHESQF